MSTEKSVLFWLIGALLRSVGSVQRAHGLLEYTKWNLFSFNKDGTEKLFKTGAQYQI